MTHKISPIKYPFLFITYIWMRLDPILWITFKGNWTPRYEFLASIFGEKDAEEFLKHRVKLVKSRNKKNAPQILPKHIEEKTNQFMDTSPETKTAKATREKIIKKLIFWALDSEINQQNIDSYKTRSAIINSLLGTIFQNSLVEETKIIFKGLKKIVFSRITYLGSKGEPSPIVHDVIIAGVGRVLTAHFFEIVRLREEKVDQITKIQLIKEIKKDQEKTGSLAFSGDIKKDDVFKHKYPLPEESVKMLLEILVHYQYSAWPDSREKAKELFEIMEDKLGFKLDESFLIKCE